MSLSEPHINHGNGPVRGIINGIYLSIYLSIYISIYLSIYLCLYHLPRPAFVALWFPRSVYSLKCSMYSSILTCSHALFTTACTRSTEQQGCLEHVELLMSAVKIIDEDRKVNAQTRGLNGFSLLR